MTGVSFKSGNMRSYIANVEFSLNFDSKDTPSVKIKKGEEIIYDGQTASYTNFKDGSETKGKTLSLRKAISSGWLVLSDPDAKNNIDIASPIPPSGPQYDKLKGGNFDEYIEKEIDGGRISVAGRTKIIREDSLIVKKTEPTKASQSGTPDLDKSKLEIAGDQVGVKELSGKSDRIVVTSTTITPKIKDHSKEVVSAEDYGADSTTPLKMKKKEEEQKPDNTYTVDDKTPRISENATSGDIKKAKKIISVEESQDATIVSSIGKKAQDSADQTQAPDQTQASDQTLTTDQQKESTVKKKLKVEPIEDQAAQVVGRIKKEKKIRIVDGITLRVPETKGSSETNSEGIILKEVKVGISDKGITTTATVGSGGNTPVTDLSSPKAASSNYLSILPDDWASLHWTKKEKFIKNLNDIEFVKFIKMVETVKAVQKACDERIKELEKSS